MGASDKSSAVKTLRDISSDKNIFKPSGHPVKNIKLWVLDKFKLIHPAQKILSDAHRTGHTLSDAISNKRSATVNRWRSEQARRFRDLKTISNSEAIRSVGIGNAVFKNANIKDVNTSNIDLSSISPNSEVEIFIINNNDVYRMGLERYVTMYLQSPEKIFVIWDWDNHHAISRSMVLATFCDFYVPAHFDFYSQLADVSDAVSAPIWAATNQWSRTFLRENMTHILNVDRNQEPLGKHMSYAKFRRREEILSKLSNVYMDVGWVGFEYHDMNELDRLQEWCNHMAHWIVPVRNDISIRIFDALITGGIPIVPRALEYHPALARVREHIVFYGDADIEDPTSITRHANAKFTQSGADGMMARVELAMQNCHVDSSLREIVERVGERYSPQSDI